MLKRASKTVKLSIFGGKILGGWLRLVGLEIFDKINRKFNGNEVNEREGRRRSGGEWMRWR